MLVLAVVAFFCSGQELPNVSSLYTRRRTVLWFVNATAVVPFFFLFVVIVVVVSLSFARQLFCCLCLSLHLSSSLRGV